MKDNIKEAKKLIKESELELENFNYEGCKANAFLAMAKINYETHLLLKEQTIKKSIKKEEK